MRPFTSFYYTLLITKINFCNPCTPPKALVFVASKRGLKPDLHPRPLDLHQSVPVIIANTPGKLMVPGRSFWKSIFWQVFSPCPPGHLPPQN
jgi:hypothetical protein